MSRPVALLLAATLALTACSQPSGLRLQAEVDDQTRAVTVPLVAWPAVNLDAGFAGDPAATGSLGASGTARTVGLGTVVTVTTVSVAEGDTVTAGQTVATLDDRLLTASLAAAEADAKVAAAQADVIADRLTEVTDAQADLADKRAEVVDAIAELKKKRAEVEDAIKKLTRTRADLREKRAEAAQGRKLLLQKRQEVENALAALPEDSPGRVPLQAALAEINTKLAQVQAGLKKLDAGLKQLDAGLKQAKAGLKKLKKGLQKATDGLADLDEAAEELRDARAELGRLRRLARIAADTAEVPVALARTRVDDTVLTAPVEGTVVSVVPAGSQLAPGATVVTIRPTGATRLVTWLSPAQAAAACLGDPASVSTDWSADPLAASISRIATTAEYPPSTHASEEVHLTRAFRTELATDAVLPAGAPVTVTITPCRPAAAGA